jgi:hypothetical protein
MCEKAAIMRIHAPIPPLARQSTGPINSRTIDRLDFNAWTVVHAVRRAISAEGKA